MKVNITQGRRQRQPEKEGRVYNDARRLYDRLRKRSYRRALASTEAWGTYYATLDAEGPQPEDEWTWHDHAAYVEAVRDTIYELIGNE